MRNYKFRAWDINKKVYIPTEYWAVVTTDFGAFGIMLKDWEDYKEGEYFYSNSQVLQQFTGLHDKNGVEVWEGDIVRCGYGVGQVIYNAGCFMVQWIDDKEAYMEFFFSKKGMYARKDDELFEIIGNVFDNPELL